MVAGISGYQMLQMWAQPNLELIHQQMSIILMSECHVWPNVHNSGVWPKTYFLCLDNSHFSCSNPFSNFSSFFLWSLECRQAVPFLSNCKKLVTSDINIGFTAGRALICHPVSRWSHISLSIWPQCVPQYQLYIPVFQVWSRSQCLCLSHSCVVYLSHTAKLKGGSGKFW